MGTAQSLPVSIPGSACMVEISPQCGVRRFGTSETGDGQPTAARTFWFTTLSASLPVTFSPVSSRT